MDRIIKLENVDQYNNLYGLETLHPLVSIVDLTRSTRQVNHIQMNYGLYALFLKQTRSCNIKYGRTSYDYEEGTIVCFQYPQHLCRLFKKRTGCTPNEYRLQHA